MNDSFYPLPWPVLLLVTVLLSACAGDPAAPVLAGNNSRNVDFSGSWEMDYSQSDEIQTVLDTMVRDLRKRAQRRSQNGMNQGGAGLLAAYGPDSGTSIIGLARMADLITQTALLTIEQKPHRIKVAREESFALECEFYADHLHTVQTPLGSESCGWDGHQLLFRIALPEGLTIQHVMTLGPQRQKLNIATTLVSDQVSYPFTLNRVYNRFTPGKNGIHCKMTLTRGRVCTTESPR